MIKINDLLVPVRYGKKLLQTNGKLHDLLAKNDKYMLVRTRITSSGSTYYYVIGYAPVKQTHSTIRVTSLVTKPQRVNVMTWRNVKNELLSIYINSAS